MSNDTRLLNDADLATITGGAGTIALNTTSNILVPHIARDKDLLTAQQIDKMLSIFGGFNPPIPPG